MPAAILTVSGLPGSGTSTACALLRERLGWHYVNAGKIFRDMASERGLTLAEWGVCAEADPRIDRELDERMVQVARQEQPVILEGRMTGWMALRGGLTALKVWLEAAVEVRAQRVGVRDGDSQALEKMQVRQASEAQRYREHHGIDIADLSIYDVVIDTVAHSPTCVAERIERALGGR